MLIGPVGPFLSVSDGTNGEASYGFGSSLMGESVASFVVNAESAYAVTLFALQPVLSE